MRSFSNIMPNFAGNLHLLVDSIHFFSPPLCHNLFTRAFGDIKKI